MICMNNKLKEYLDKTILPRYKKVDKGHDKTHILQVIDNSLMIAKEFDVNMDIVYTIAMFHDIGIILGRKTHHLTSARFAYHDVFLNQYFNGVEMTIIKEAIEDHRASLKNEARSIYGKIIAEADRDIDPLRIIQRTHQYTLKHYPHFNKEEQFESDYSHLVEKYGEEGYVYLPLHSKYNEEGLKTLRAWLKDKEKLYKIIENEAA